MPKKKMQEYHYIWLNAHPDRTETWLKDCLKDGFLIHHLDGNHSNNVIDNLLLIEKSDHLMLHEEWKTIRFLPRKKKVKKLKSPGTEVIPKEKPTTIMWDDDKKEFVYSPWPYAKKD